MSSELTTAGLSLSFPHPSQFLFVLSKKKEKRKMRSGEFIRQAPGPSDITLVAKIIII